MDNLNTHTPGSLYQMFDAAEAKRLADKLKIHYTPKHASWLNMVKTELSCPVGNAWTAPFPTGKRWPPRPSAWIHDRNLAHSTIDRRFHHC
jgi:hypothetical protein